MTYQDTLSNMILSKNFPNTICTDSLSIKQGDITYTYKSPTSVGDDYWIIQHYKTMNISNIPPQDR